MCQDPLSAKKKGGAEAPPWYERTVYSMGAAGAGAGAVACLSTLKALKFR